MRGLRNPPPGGSNIPLNISKCCFCLKFPEGKIFQCKKGHPICDNCYARKGPESYTCPKCKTQLPLKNKIRNEFLETILDGMRFDCEFGGNGCKRKLIRQMLSIHRKTCAYRNRIGAQKKTTVDPTQSSSQNTAGTSVTVKQMRTTSSVMDLDEDDVRVIIDQAKNPSKTAAAEEIILSDDEESEVDSPGENNSRQTMKNKGTGKKRRASEMDNDIEVETAGDRNQNSRTHLNPETPSSSRYRLRPKRKLNYSDKQASRFIQKDTNSRDDDEGRGKQVCEIFSLLLSQISKLTRQPKQVEQYNKCKIFILDGRISRKKEIAVEEFFSIWGHQFQDVFVRMLYNDKNIKFFKGVLQSGSNLTRLSYQYQHGQDALQLLAALRSHKKKGNLQALTCFKLVGEYGMESLTNEHIIKLSKVGINFQSLEIGDSLEEDVKPSSVEKLLENCKSSLETLIIHGGFLGWGDKAHKILTFPRMEVLSTFQICPNYGFLSEFKDPVSKKARIVHLNEEQEEPFKVSVQFRDNFPNLKVLVLGSLITVEDLSFSTVRKLEEFRCGSFWNLSLRFPLESSRISLRQRSISSVTDFQFPDGLKDPSLPAKVVRHFPHLKKIHLYLPSMAVLQGFFQAFENSGVENLCLKIQFDFESTLESCLLPGNVRVKAVDERIKTLIKMLKNYKHFEEYATYYNLHLPAQQVDDDVKITNYAGIGGLTNLKVFELQHIPRRLLIPVEREERKWYDYNCKFINATFGLLEYPLEYKCHQEILKLGLVDFTSRCIKIAKSQVGILNQGRGGGGGNADIRFRVITLKDKVGRSSRVKYLPSLLLPDIKIKREPDY